MISTIQKFILISLILFSCQGKSTRKSFSYDFFDRDEVLDTSLSLRQMIVSTGDSVEIQKWSSRTDSTYIIIRKDGIYESSKNSKSHFLLSHSFIDTTSYTSAISPFSSQSKSRLLKKKNILISDKNIPVYMFYEDSERASLAAISYYSPEIGFLIYYKIESGSTYVLQNEDYVSGTDLIKIIQSDTNFYAKHLFRNPPVHSINLLPK